MVDKSRSLLETLRKRLKNWIGHVLRHDSLLQKVIEERFQGKKTPGRPRAMLLDALMQEDDESDIDYAKLKGKAHAEKLDVTEEEPAFGQKTPDGHTSPLMLTVDTCVCVCVL